MKSVKLEVAQCTSRVGISILLLILAYRETGPWSTVIFTLLLTYMEAMYWVWKAINKAATKYKDMIYLQLNDGPGEEDGPWAPGWKKRTGEEGP